MSDPFDLEDHAAYLAWRDRKLDGYPSSIDTLRVEIARPPALSAGERARLLQLLAKANMAVVVCASRQRMDAGGLLTLGRQLGLDRLDSNLFADERAVSTLSVRATGPASEYIPYTNRPLSWHTDGYYNPPERQVRAWMLYCVQDAATGGGNALLDHEIAYIRLRDRDPELIRALMAPQVMAVPPNRDEGVEIRPASVGPVFSVRDGFLHMRYSARNRNIVWHADRRTDAAREELGRLFSSDDVYIFRHKLAPGEGYVSNNVLHNRTGFQATVSGQPQRVLLRTRYLDRVTAPTVPRA